MTNKLIALAFVLAVFIPFTYSNWGLTESSEARYAQIGKEMYQSHDFLNPTILGINHYHKPPVTYYFTALGYTILGVNEYGARFFLQVALVLQLLLVFLIAQKLQGDRKVSLAATLIYFSYPIVQIAAKNLTTDAYLTTFIFASIYFFLQYRLLDKVKFLYLFYLCCGLAFLTKGPVGVLPQIIFALVYVKSKKIKFRFGLHQWLGIIFFLLLSASWFLVLILRNEKFVSYFFEYQLVDRVSGDTFKRSKPFWYYILFMPLLALPAFLYFIDFIITRFSGAKKRYGNLITVLMLPLVIMFFIFSLSSSKLVFYVLPLYLFIALCSAKYISDFSPAKLKKYKIVGLVFGLLIFSALIAGCFIDIPFTLPKMPLITLGTLSIILLLFLFRSKIFRTSYLHLSFLNAAVTGLLIFILPVIMKANEIKINSIKPIAAFIDSLPRNGAVTVYDYLLPSLAFYTNRPVITVHNQNNTSVRELYFTKDPAAGQYPYFNVSDSTYNVDSLKKATQNSPYLLVPRKYQLPDSLSFLNHAHTVTAFEDQWKLYH